jgi:hypothetical protein
VVVGWGGCLGLVKEAWVDSGGGLDQDAWVEEVGGGLDLMTWVVREGDGLGRAIWPRKKGSDSHL